MGWNSNSFYTKHYYRHYSDKELDPAWDELPIHERYMDYSVKHLLVSDDKQWCRDDLWSYDRVEKITINGDWEYVDGVKDDISGCCSYLQHLKEFEVINSSKGLFVEDGALYAYVKGGMASRFYRGSFPWLKEIEGKVLLAVPPAYPNKEFKVADGTVGIFPGAFGGARCLESIRFPETIEYVDFHCLDDVPNLKLLYIPNKIIHPNNHFKRSPKPELCCTNPSQILSQEVMDCWIRWKDDDYYPVFETDLIDSYVYRHPVFPNDTSKKTILDAISCKEKLVPYYKELGGKAHEIELATLLMWVEPRIVHPETDEEANIIIDLIWGSKQKATSHLRYFPDKYVDVIHEEEQEVVRKIKEYRKTFLGITNDEEPDILKYIHQVKDNMVLLEMAYNNPIEFLNTQRYATILYHLRSRATYIFKKHATRNVYAAMNWLYMEGAYRMRWPSLYDCRDIDKIQKRGAEMGDMISMEELANKDSDGLPHFPIYKGSDIYYWHKILASKGVGLSQDEIDSMKRMAKHNLESDRYREPVRVYNNVKEEVFERAEKLAREEMGLDENEQMLGLCYVIWKHAKSIFHDEYDIDWKSPAEINPDAIFD